MSDGEDQTKRRKRAWLTTAEAAEIAEVDRTTVYLWAKRYEGLARRVGQRYRVDPAVLNLLLEGVQLPRLDKPDETRGDPPLPFVEWRSGRKQPDRQKRSFKKQHPSTFTVDPPQRSEVVDAVLVAAAERDRQIAAGESYVSEPLDGEVDEHGRPKRTRLRRIAPDEHLVPVRDRDADDD